MTVADSRWPLDLQLQFLLCHFKPKAALTAPLGPLSPSSTHSAMWYVCDHQLTLVLLMQKYTLL